MNTKCQVVHATTFDALGDGTSATFRKALRRKVEEMSRQVSNAVAARKRCAVVDVSVSTSQRGRDYVATVTWPGGVYTSRPCPDEIVALTAAQIAA